MKKIIIAVIFSFSLCSFGQKYYSPSEMRNGLELYNGITVVRDSLGITFIGKNGIKYNRYFDKASVEIRDGLIYVCYRMSYGDVIQCLDLEIIPFMKVVEQIEELNIRDKENFIYFNQFRSWKGEISYRNRPDWFLSGYDEIPEYGAIYKNGKYARISKYGEILTDFKYDNRECSSFTEFDENNNPKKIYVVRDKGTEIFKSENPIERYWDEKNYLTLKVSDSDKREYYFMYEGKEYVVDYDLVYYIYELKGLPYQSDIFICGDSESHFNTNYDERWFYKLDKGKIKPKRKNFRPETRFYNNNCIVSEKKGKKKLYHIINNEFKIIKTLSNEIESVEESFDKNGIALVASQSNLKGLIDYQGNIVIPIEYHHIFEDYPKVYFAGKYDRYYKIIEDESTYFNQKGERIEKEELEQLKRKI